MVNTIADISHWYTLTVETCELICIAWRYKNNIAMNTTTTTATATATNNTTTTTTIIKYYKNNNYK